MRSFSFHSFFFLKPYSILSHFISSHFISSYHILSYLVKFIANKQTKKTCYLSLGRLIFGCLGQRLLSVKSFRTILLALPKISLVLVSS